MIFELVEYLAENVKVEEFYKLEKVHSQTIKKFKIKMNENKVFEKMGYGKIRVQSESLKNIIRTLKYYCKNRERENISKDDFCKCVENYKKILYDTGSTRVRDCIGLYFLLQECNLIKMDNKVEFYKQIAGIYKVNYDFTNFTEMKDVVLYLVLVWDKKLKDFIQFLNEGNELLKESEGDLNFPFAKDRRSLSFDEFEKIVKEGLSGDEESTVRETRKSVKNTRTYMSKLMKNEKKAVPYDSLKEWFNDHDTIKQTICNTEKRRIWYVYNIISKIIEKQIKDIKRDYKNNRNKESNSQFVELRKRLWLKKTNYQEGFPVYFTKSWSEVDLKSLKECDLISAKKDEFNSYLKMLRNPDKAEECAKIGRKLKEKYQNENLDDSIGKKAWLEQRIKFLENPVVEFEEVSPELLEQYLKASIINIPSIRAAFEEYFDNWERYRTVQLNRESIFDKAIYRKSFHRTEYVEIARAGKGQGRREFVWDILTGKVRVTKELLLLFILLAKLYDVESIDKIYIKEHILENSRFNPVLEGKTCFERYYLQVLNQFEEINNLTNINKFDERVKVLKRASWEMEEEYLNRFESVAPFREIVCGGEIN